MLPTKSVNVQTESFPGTRVPFYKPQTGKRERELLERVLASNYLNEGDVARGFETMVAEAVGVEHCVAVTSGTVAIALALMACDVKAGDEVIVPDLTFIATANAARLAGANVRLVDVEPQTFCIDPARLEDAIGPKTTAVLTVDINGRGARYEEIELICQRHGVKLICDAAEALGSQYAGKRLGDFGDLACFSFSANKRICTGQGGAVVTNQPDLASRVRELKDQGRRSQGTGGDDVHPVLGFNFKFTNIQAAIGVAQIERLKERLEHARNLYHWYRERLYACPGIELPVTNEKEAVLQWFDILVDDRPRLSCILRQHGIGHRAFWHPLHTQPPYQSEDVSFRAAIDVSRRGLWLPSDVTMTRKDVSLITGVIRSVFSHQ